MYQWLNRNGIEYDECLDWAVLLHDVVWDELPDREFRSAVWAQETLTGVLSDSQVRMVCDLIMSTIHHEVTRPEFSAIVRADLHSLVSPIDCIANYALLVQEAFSVCGVPLISYANGSLTYMQQLENRIMHNMHYYDVEHADFYARVSRGIALSVSISEGVLQSYANTASQ